MGEKGDRRVQFYSAVPSPTQTSLRKRKSCLLNFLLGSPKCKSCASEGLGLSGWIASCLQIKRKIQASCA